MANVEDKTKFDEFVKKAHKALSDQGVKLSKDDLAKAAEKAKDDMEGCDSCANGWRW